MPLTGAHHVTKQNEEEHNRAAPGDEANRIFFGVLLGKFQRHTILPENLHDSCQLLIRSGARRAL